MFVGGGGGGGGGGGSVDVFCVCVELGETGRVQLEDHSPKWRALRNFSFQPCMVVQTHVGPQF